jgi:transketolase
MNDAVVTTTFDSVSPREMANAIRFLAVDGVEKAKSGHPGMPMGMADVATVLFSRFMNFDPAAPRWPDRDRFVLSAGHGSMLLYALLYLTGYPEMTIDQIKSFRQWGSNTPGHPEYGHTQGVETTTGPLGQGLATAVGMALAERLANARHGDTLVDHFTYVIDGDTCLSCSDDQIARFRASGWSADRVDGHDPGAVARAIEAARRSDRPSLIACKTIIGFGAPTKKGTEKAHGAPLGAEERAGAAAALDWRHAPFEIPEGVIRAWRATAERGATKRAGWLRRAGAIEAATRRALEETQATPLPETYGLALERIRSRFASTAPKIATRQASQQVLDEIAPTLPGLVGGSTDLTHSNLTHAKGQRPVRPGDFSGSYIHYGVREFGMAAAMNGIALYGGMIPYGGTFLAFADYNRPAIRLAALMGVRAIHVMTHDSIGLGEDGPTHQPVEHFAALRAIPNLNVFRPADAVETAEAWDCALRAHDRPSILCLSRQGLPALRQGAEGPNKTALGAYVLIEPVGPRDVTLIATGSEVSVAVEAAAALAGKEIRAAVVSAPCFELFVTQPASYRASVLGAASRVGVEAGVEGLWPRWLGDDSAFVGMKGFGASAPAETLYREFGLTANAVAAHKLVARRK